MRQHAGDEANVKIRWILHFLTVLLFLRLLKIDEMNRPENSYIWKVYTLYLHIVSAAKILFIKGRIEKLRQLPYSREQKHVSISDTPILLIEINSIK